MKRTQNLTAHRDPTWPEGVYMLKSANDPEMKQLVQLLPDDAVGEETQAAIQEKTKPADDPSSIEYPPAAAAGEVVDPDPLGQR